MIDWISVLIQIGPAFLTQAFLHEAAHAVAAMSHGMQITSFRFWPHVTRTNKGPRWYFWGRVTYTPRRGMIMVADERGWRALAPFFVTIPIWSMGLVMHDQWHRLPNAALEGVIVFWTVQTIDLMRSFLGVYQRRLRGDLGIASQAFQWPLWVIRIVAAVCLCGTAFAWGAAVGPFVIGD